MENEYVLNGLIGDLDTPEERAIEGVRQRFIEVGAPIGKQHFLNFWEKLPKHVQEGILQGKMRIIGHTIYAEKALSGTTVEMFKASDRYEIGKTNIDGNKLPKDKYHSVTAIKFIYSTSPSTAADYAQKFIPDLVLAGDIKFWHANKGVFDKGFPMTTFASLPGYCTDKPYGQANLNSPVLLEPIEEFTLDVNFTRSIDAGYLRVELIGATILPV